jgi:hypothetical protein
MQGLHCENARRAGRRGISEPIRQRYDGAVEAAEERKEGKPMLDRIVAETNKEVEAQKTRT